jgi:hypothetical protein
MYKGLHTLNKNDRKENESEKLKLSLAAIASLFLIALFLISGTLVNSPVYSVALQGSVNGSLSQNDKLLSPNANGQPLVGNSINLPTPAGNEAYPKTTTCTYVADGIGGVQVFQDGKIPKLIASIFVKLTSKDPYTCPEGTLYVSGVGVLVSDHAETTMQESSVF